MKFRMLRALPVTLCCLTSVAALTALSAVWTAAGAQPIYQF